MFERELERIVGSGHVLTDRSSVLSYGNDWTGRFPGHTQLVVRPADALQVAAALEVCGRFGIAIVPQGGNTGLVGGGVPMDGEVVLSLQRLRHVEVDDVERTLTAGAGATIQSIQEAAAAAGLFYGVDLASRGSATVGGTIATNAGGLRVMRYGDTRAQVLGVEVAFSTGRVVSGLGRLRRDNCGYHLPSLMCGSEGTLGVVTAATLRLHSSPR